MLKSLVHQIDYLVASPPEAWIETWLIVFVVALAIVASPPEAWIETKLLWTE